MSKEERVIYQGKEYIIVHKYDSGYVEIKQLGKWNADLVHQSELKPIQQENIIPFKN